MKTYLAAAGLALGLASMAFAGNTWHEQGDAGNGVNGDAQETGTGPLAAIIGATGGSDEVDAYCISIVNYVDFTASLSNAGTNFDTQLFSGAPIVTLPPNVASVVDSNMVWDIS